MQLHNPLYSLDRPCAKLLGFLVAMAWLLVFPAYPVHAGVIQGEVTALEGEYIRIDRGSEAGLKVGDQGRVYYTVLVGKERRPQPVYVASFTITGIDQGSSAAKVEQAQGQIMVGYLVEATPAEAPSLQQAPMEPVPTGGEKQPATGPPPVTPPPEQRPSSETQPAEKKPVPKVVKKKQAVKRPLKAGEVWRDALLGMSFVWVPEGCFEMGCGGWMAGCSDSEKPPHTVCLRGYWIGRHEVTQQQWRRLMGNNPSYFNRCGTQCPVEQVSWNDAVEFARRLSAKTGDLFRLPTEAEWEYACRSGGRQQSYAGGEALDAAAWYKENADDGPHPVGRKRPNDLGIYDMSGNVWEWCLDCFDKDAYLKAFSSLENPVFIGEKYADIYGEGYARIRSILQKASEYRSVRGGSWKNAADRLRSTDRIRGKADSGRDWLGFRLVREEIRKQ